jgi:hypothetical protein
MDHDDDRPVPRGLLFILDNPEERELYVAHDAKPGELDSLRFDKKVCDLFSQGLCVMPRIKWVN